MQTVALLTASVNYESRRERDRERKKERAFYPRNTPLVSLLLLSLNKYYDACFVIARINEDSNPLHGSVEEEGQKYRGERKEGKGAGSETKGRIV